MAPWNAKPSEMGVMADVGARTPSNIVNLLTEHYDILQSSHQEDIKTSERSRAKRMIGIDMLYFMSSGGEHINQVRVGLAMLNNLKAYDKAGNDVGSMLDMHTVKDGKLIVPKDAFIKNSKGEIVPFNTTEQNRISNKIGAVLRKAHGNYSAETANYMQQDARLAMFMKFRGWMREGFMKRWGKTKDYKMMEQEAEGFYRTGGRVAKQLTQDLLHLKFDLAKENWGNLSAHEKANVRRFIMEASFIVSMSAAAALLSGKAKYMEDRFGSEDITDKMIVGSYLMLVYQTNRLYSETSAYFNPIEAVRIARSPFASLSIIENTLSLMWQLGVSPTEEYETGWRKGQNKAAVKAGKLIPIYKQFETLNPDGIKEKTKYFN